ncbi:hypothetical protein AMJ51_00695 [Microgenomates bacterium DG_75]|nr:MAG: hypothetical protein AMJ51_00695 [Microgenomates bacterium DG_75]
MRIPAFIKISSSPPKRAWPSVYKKELKTLKEIGKKFERSGSLYLTGSAAGREEAEKVNDLDLIMIVKDSKKIYSAKKLTERYRKIEGVEIPITYQFWPLDWVKSITEYDVSPILGPVYLTYVKTNHLHLGGEEVLEKIDWPTKRLIRESAIRSVKQAILEIFKLIDLSHSTKKENYLLLKYIREVVFKSVFAKFYFGFSKSEIIKLFLQKYRLQNNKPIKIFYKTRIHGKEYFFNQDPKRLQNSTLVFAQEMWNKIERI